MKSKPSRKPTAPAGLPEPIREFVAREVTLPLTELIKPESNPDNFIQRCRELGFQVRSL